MSHVEQWQYMQISDALDREFATALSHRVPVTAWRPRMETWALFAGSGGGEMAEETKSSGLSLRSFPLQRGYARPPLSWLSRTGSSLRRRLLRQTARPATTPLVCSTPYHAPLAAVWPGPVVYYLTDRIAAYAGVNSARVIRLDRRMCAAARLVCPNSARLADYLTQEAGCDPAKILVVPNATRAANLLPAPLLVPDALPADADGLERPVAGVIGNMGSNVDWLLVRALVDADPEFSWLLVGPVGQDVPDAEERSAREDLLQRGGRIRFVGRKPYGELAAYARSLDVAVLPYKLREPTYSGSSTRFYEHLAATRPILSTRGFEELLHKPPLLRLFDTAEEGAALLGTLQASGFNDGQTEARWLASQEGTWECRAAAMIAALSEAGQAIR